MTMLGEVHTVPFDMADAAAKAVYEMAQAHLEEPQAHRMASLVGGYEDANEYTRKLFREIVQVAARELKPVIRQEIKAEIFEEIVGGR
jgi:hypothetical protein